MMSATVRSTSADVSRLAATSDAKRSSKSADCISSAMDIRKRNSPRQLLSGARPHPASFARHLLPGGEGLPPLPAPKGRLGGRLSLDGLWGEDPSYANSPHG